MRIRVLEHKDQWVQLGQNRELDLTQIGATLISRGPLDGLPYHQETIWELTERQQWMIPMLPHVNECEIQQWWQDEDIPELKTLDNHNFLCYNKHS